ncbi:NAD(P)-binding protein [Marinobacterium aestuariivivens]|uniref:NAD(P)-binding protein n=1 Tax=Marinobacterium aestuariivivens TaxID=1698799 RepID=A0ABW2A0N8_9GAMM
MLLDARDFNVTLERSVDLAIVGAGPAGLVLARELADRASVMVIESGGLGADPQVDALQQGESIGLDYPLTETRARGFGGSASLWAGYCALFDRHDFLERPWVAGSGWPFGIEALEPYYPRVAKLLNLGDANFDARAIAAQAGSPLPIDSPQVIPTVWRFGMPIQRFGEPLLQAFQSATAITVLSHATVVDIRLNSGHQVVTELVVRTLNGRQGRIRPKVVVLACGGLETPRLLLNADSQVSGGLGNSSDLVGRYFMEHPHFAITSFELTQPGMFAHWAERGRVNAGLEYLSCLGLSAEVQEALGVLNARLHLYRTPSMTETDTPGLASLWSKHPIPLRV